MQTIFYLEYRGNMFMFHFLVYVLGGLYLIDNKIYDKRGPPKTSGLLTNNHIVNVPTNISDEPYCIYIPKSDLQSWHYELFDIIKDKFILIDTLPNDNYEIISIYGISNSINAFEIQCIKYVSGLIIDKINYPLIERKFTYISRKFSAQNHNELRRHVLNEEQLIDMLKKYNFDVVYLEDLTFHDKVKLFQESKLIVSTHGSQGSCMMFANNCTYIEMCKHGTSGFPNNQITEICHVLNKNYKRYSDICEDYRGNFNLNIDEFEKYLKQFIN